MEERIARLERSNRRWRAATVFVVICGLVAAAEDRNFVEELRVKQLKILDVNEKSRLLIDAKDGEPTITFFDGKGQVVMSLYALANGTTVLGMRGTQLDGSPGKGDLSLGFSPGGNPSFEMTDSKGKTLMSVPQRR